MNKEHFSNSWNKALMFCRHYGFCLNANKWSCYEKIMFNDVYKRLSRQITESQFINHPEYNANSQIYKHKILTTKKETK